MRNKETIPRNSEHRERSLGYQAVVVSYKNEESFEALLTMLGIFFSIP